MRQKNINRDKLRKNNLFRLVYLILFLVGPVLIFEFLGNLTKLRDIECMSQYGSCNLVVKSRLGQVKGERYLKAVGLVRKILSEEVLVEKFNLQYKLYGVKVNLVERLAKYALSKGDNNEFLLVDKDSRVLGVTEITELPTVYFSGNLPTKGQKIASELQFALDVVSQINSIYQVKKGHIEGDSLNVELPNKLKVIFPLRGDVQVLIGSLILIYNDITSQGESKLNTEGKIIGTIDLRFNNPVLH